MAPQQKRSFLPYTNGIDPESLRLGSLYLNPLDPDDGLESRRFEYREDLEQNEYEEHIKTWTRREQNDERGFYLNFELSKDASVALKFSDWAKAEGGADSTISTALVGKSGRRLKIKKPETFLREAVIKQDGVEEWIRTQASISFRGHFGYHKWKAPEIWMVTGLQLVSGGNMQTVASRSAHAGLGGGVDAGVLLGGPPGVAAVSAEANISNTNQAATGSGYNDERVWAAQFMELAIEYGDQEDPTLTTDEHKVFPKTIATFKLKDIADLKARGIRAGQEQRDQRDSKPPKPIGRITIAGAEGHKDEEETEDYDGIELNDTHYIEAMRDTDWGMYSECAQYLIDAETGR